MSIVAQSGAPKISAILVSYYTGPILARSLAALREQPEIGEIILVDNGNIDGDIEKALSDLKAGAPVQVLSGHGNIGFAAACNKGAAAALYDRLLFINPDAILPPEGAAQLIFDSQKLDRPWLMGAKLVGPDGEEQQGSRRETLTPWRAFVEAGRLYKLAPRHPYFRRFNLHAGKCPYEVVETPTLSGACLFVPIADYDAIGGMDEHYFLHVEDVDFCLRFSNNGGKVYFNPHVSILHYKSSSRANPIKIEARKTASMIRYFNTHFSDAYPKPFLWLVSGLLWGLFGILFVKRAIAKFFRLIGIWVRSGGKAVNRVRAMSDRRSSR